jgi:hypothetical protein
MVVREMNFMRRNVGQVIVASAIIDDTIGWVIIAITFSLALHGSLDLMSLGQSVIGTAIFLFVSFTIGRRLVFRLIRWTNDTFVSDAAVITTILVIMGVMALITQAIGVHTVLGAFVAGILVGESPILTRHIDEQLRGLIVALFMPVFFGLAGLSADVSILRNPNLFLLTLGLILIASVGKFAGAFTGGWFGGLARAEALALAGDPEAAEQELRAVALEPAGAGDMPDTLVPRMCLVQAFVARTRGDLGLAERRLEEAARGWRRVVGAARSGERLSAVLADFGRPVLGLVDADRELARVEDEQRRLAATPA